MKWGTALRLTEPSLRRELLKITEVRGQILLTFGRILPALDRIVG
jgi:hypothetical protein